MTKKLEIYKCDSCGNMIEVIHASRGILICCDEPMSLLNENVIDASNEKHIPVITKEDDKVTVSIGSIEHPMEEKHYIEWIELITKDNVYKKYLSPNQKSVAEFKIEQEALFAREFCNVHGLWSTK